jgi:hypothetical protein
MRTRIDPTSHTQDIGSSAKGARSMTLWRTRVGQLSRVSIDYARSSRLVGHIVPQLLKNFAISCEGSGNSTVQILIQCRFHREPKVPNISDGSNNQKVPSIPMSHYHLSSLS